MLKNNKLGFTLVELLVVIAIFALITNVTMISLNKAKRDSRDAKRISDINQLRSALHLYSIEKLSYPAGDGIALGISNNLILDFTGWVGSSPTSPIYMYIIPRDPRMVSATSDNPCTAASTDICDYGYTVDVVTDDYTIYFFGVKFTFTD